ncbi:YqaA family protein [Paenibacillus paeoniae]|uniref:DedA family protein n=1 Tax=Paenibacillus paeoniae TaxID=2292705 RepID=A0A371PLP6_9BACL|nr:VTT domain-containing protein [Paenibacillus paeoniae]REK76677.1 DedA family protein [Paenibacillus paeoniae]
MFNNIIDYVLNYGAWGLFIHSFADAVIFPIPALFTQVSLNLLDPSNALWLATIGFVGCLLGTPFGYWIGRGLGHSVMNRMLKKSWVDAATRMIQKNGEAAILVGSFTPIPFKVFTILSGCLSFPLWRLMAYAAIGRAVKFYLVGVLFYLYGRSAEGMVKHVSLYLFIAVVPIILVILFIRKRQKRKAEQLEQTEDDQVQQDQPRLEQHQQIQQ